LFDPAQLLAEPIISCRQRRAKRPIQPRPGGHGTRARLFDHDFAGAIEANDPRHFDAHGLIEGDTGTAQHGGELRMGAKADAAAGQIFPVTLEYQRIPAAAPKEIGRQQPAQRSADDEGAAGHASFRGAPEARSRNP
jgi:hypothetical protein